VILAILRAADHKEAVRRMPWSVIMMMTRDLLISLLEKTGGLDLFNTGWRCLRRRRTSPASSRS